MKTASLFVLVALLLTTSCATPTQFLRTNIAPHVNALKFLGDAHCTAFDLNVDGKVRTITNAHCCDQPTGTLSINGKIVSIVKKDVGADLCELSGSKQSSGLELSVVEAKVMDEIHSIGFPSYYNKTIRSGNMSGVISIPRLNSYELNLTNFHVFGGASGSPVVNTKGQVVGVIAITNQFAEGVFIKLERLKAFLYEK